MATTTLFEPTTSSDYNTSFDDVTNVSQSVSSTTVAPSDNSSGGLDTYNIVMISVLVSFALTFTLVVTCASVCCKDVFRKPPSNQTDSNKSHDQRINFRPAEEMARIKLHTLQPNEQTFRESSAKVYGFVPHGLNEPPSYYRPDSMQFCAKNLRETSSSSSQTSRKSTKTNMSSAEQGDSSPQPRTSRDDMSVEDV